MTKGAETKRIIVVDDEAGILLLLRKVLKDSNFEIFTAESGEEAMKFLKKARFDVLLADIMMPGMSGLELMVEARKLDPQICCVIMTAYANLDTFTESVRKGAIDFVSKPFNVNELSGKLLEAYDRQKKAIEDVGRRERARLSNLDPLTELPNVRKFYSSLDELLNGNHPIVSVLYVDVNALRIINVAQGMETGDMVLKSLAETLIKKFPPPASACRYGGDEFMLNLPNTPLQEGTKIGKKLKDEMVKVVVHPESGNAREIPLSVDVAVAGAPEDGNKSHLLVNAAVRKMHEIKKR